ncbi:MAG TPA: LamG domain-containing protein, partial [Armatimonadota bacterium]
TDNQSATGTSSAVEGTVTDSALQCFWRMNENTWTGAAGEVQDTANNHSGTAINSATTITDGKIGRCGTFNGINQYVEVPDAAALKYTGGNFSLALWVKIDANDTDGGHLISKPWNWNGSYNWRVQMYSDRTLRLALSGATSWYSTQTSALSAGVWHHIAVTLSSGSTVILYVDGSPAVTSTHTITNWTPVNGDKSIPLAFGTLYPYGTGGWQNSIFCLLGQMDEVRLYTRVLTQAEIAGLAQGKQ